MATNELKHQADLIKSAKRDGGYGFKMSNRFLIGVPDLFLVYPEHGIMVAEVKDLGEVRNKFDRQLDVTDKQGQFLTDIQKPVPENMGRVAFVIVHIQHWNEHRVVVMPGQARRLSSDYEAIPDIWSRREPGLYYNIRPALAYWGAARVADPVLAEMI